MSLVGRNPDYRPAGSEGGRGFASTDHLAADAVVAYVDGELRMNAHLRAARHLERCSECQHRVNEQYAARDALRKSGEIRMPETLLGALTAIPTREFDVRLVADRARDEAEAAERKRRFFRR